MPNRVVTARVNQGGKQMRYPGLACVGAGRAHELLRAEVQNQLSLAVQECGFEYLRFHGLFHDDMGVLAPDLVTGQPVVSFHYVDMLIDALLDIGIRPFVELSFMPAPLASGGKTVFWWKGGCCMPSDMEKWCELIEASIVHWTRRYGRDEVVQWYFEVWNEPDHPGFSIGSFEDYFALYRATAETIKGIDAEYRVGGPASAMELIVPPFLDYCHVNAVPLDFVSTHTYGNFTTETLDFLGNQTSRMHDDPDSIANAVARVRAALDASAFANAELHYTEWNSSYLLTDPIHDHYFSAPYILHQLRAVGDRAHSMSYWVFSDIFEEKGVPTAPFWGGFGMMTLQGIRKPSYFAHMLMNRLGGTELECTDPDAWVCTDGERVQALIWDYSPPDSRDVNQVTFRRDTPPANRHPVGLHLEGLSPGDYTVSLCRVGHGSNDPFTDYLRLGSPRHLTRSQVADLAARSNGTPHSVVGVTIDESGRYTGELPMRENDVWLVVLEPAG